jgi:hypothetical protein
MVAMEGIEGSECVDGFSINGRQTVASMLDGFAIC